MIIAGLDVGTSKVTTVIGELAPDGVLDIIGEGNVPSQGLKRGVVVNLERTTEAIRQSVHQAERVAGVKVERVILGVGGPHLKSVTSHGLAAIRRGQSISAADVERAIEQAKAYPFDTDLELLHALPLEFKVDGQEGIRDPVGMAGVRLEVDVHLVAAGRGPLANLRRAVGEAGLEIEALVAQPLASGLGVLSPEEEHMTVLLLDVGGGTTEVAVFREGRLAHSSVLPLGGDHVTQDIAQLLKIPFEEAERVKRKYGAALPELADPELVLEINQEGGSLGEVPAPELARIIRPRLREILHLARQSVDEALGPLEIKVNRVILTGGSALLKGFDLLARQQYGLPVRVGKPHGVSGLTDVVATPAHATAVGLVRYATTLPLTAPEPRRARERRERREEKAKGEGLWARIKEILNNLF
ncbi:cell division protein FtsA [Thermus scotoductus]|uniref:Cell division protein FtsA n=1 Tax=Thermus scotoductus TaxID=37636 RepID=A0A348XPB3_THESC|nr:cell division protein FtsA [Thermus scotoductus]RTG92906.1 cell division protein FtsA [Thermus scotoductus]RTG93003.1 cell division protein FtsA [Thermus scotoductus]RTG98357.1 cell division protein FtsA [Thermus scotoductus]RTH02744.1 cell division protein FtsA [Thermus scotoductus]RTH03638.1 cell division protein FtsA [Thermus scotoductus]